jgi:hypothetical protein
MMRGRELKRAWKTQRSVFFNPAKRWFESLRLELPSIKKY